MMKGDLIIRGLIIPKEKIYLSYDNLKMKKKVKFKVTLVWLHILQYLLDLCLVWVNKYLWKITVVHKLNNNKIKIRNLNKP